MKYIIIYLLNLVDYAMTACWVGIHGIQTELNPLMRMALAQPWMFVAIKLLFFPLLLVWMRYKHHDDIAWFALGAFSAVTMLNICTIFGR